MLVELVKPVALLLCILSLYAVFLTAFLIPSSGLEQTIWASLELLAVAAGIALISGMIFLEPSGLEPFVEQSRPSASSADTRLLSTLPMQLFCWTSIAIVGLFLAGWYLGTQCPAACRDRF